MTMKSTKWAAVIGTVALSIFAMYLWRSGYLSDPEALRVYLKGLGPVAPLVFILIQIVQIVIPVIPGGVISGIGVIVFGPIEGFIYNYIGLLIGSYIMFRLVKRYGKSLILKVANKKTYDKYIGWLDKGEKFEIFFALAILLPAMPDDLLCMIAGLTSMSNKKYILINILCRPAVLVFYSLGIEWIVSFPR